MHSPLQSPLQPVMRSPLEFRRRGGFDPVSALFGSGQQGVLYDPSVMASLFQDSAGTIPVTAADQTVGKMLDLSGNGNHAIQADASKRPILRNSGSLWWLEFDGVNDFMSTGNIDFSGTDKVSCWAGVTRLSVSASLVLETSGSFNAYAGSFAIISGTDGVTVDGFTSKSRGSLNTTLGAYMSDVPMAVSHSLYITHDISGDISTIHVDGVAGTDGTQDKGAGSFGNYPIYIACRAGTSTFFNGNLYPTIIAGALYDANTVAKMNQYVAKKSGVTL